METRRHRRVPAPTDAALLFPPAAVLITVKLSPRPHPPHSAPDHELRSHCRAIAAAEVDLREGGGAAGRARQHKLGRLTARERIRTLLDESDVIETDDGLKSFLELGLWAAHDMYREWGTFNAAGVVTGI